MKKSILLFVFAFFMSVNLSFSQAQLAKKIKADIKFLEKIGVQIQNGKAIFNKTEKNSAGKIKIYKALIGYSAISQKLNKSKNVVETISPRIVTCKNDDGSWVYYQKINDFDEKDKIQDLLNKLICVNFKLETSDGVCDVDLWYESLPDFTEKLDDSVSNAIQNEMESKTNGNANYVLPNPTINFENAIIFPNPVLNQVATCEFRSNKSGTAKIELYNLQGDLMKICENNFSYINGNNRLELNFSGLSSAMYILIISDGESKAMARVLVNN